MLNIRFYHYYYYYYYCVCVHSVMSDSCDSMDFSPPGSSVHGIFQARICNGLPFPPLGDLPDPGIEPRSLMSPALAGRFFTTVLHVIITKGFFIRVLKPDGVFHNEF